MYFSEGVYSEDGEIGVGLGVAHDVEVDEFFELQGGGGDIFEYVHEERGDVFSVGHVGDDPSDGFLLLIDVHPVQFVLQFSDLAGFLLLGLGLSHPFKFTDRVLNNTKHPNQFTLPKTSLSKAIRTVATSVKLTVLT
jgi:hypothetical protein